MKLYITPTSPYARIARVAAHQSGLGDKIEEIDAVTRKENTAHFAVTPLARVPVLVDGDVCLADTRDICAYYDKMSGTMRWSKPEDHQQQYFRHITSGFLDGIAVWLRENARAENEKSLRVMGYEEHRADHVMRWLENNWKAAKTSDYAALTFVCAYDVAVKRGIGDHWPELAPTISRWAQQKAEEPAMLATLPLTL